jgi:hypothetical protein
VSVVAQAHVRATHAEAAGGERIIVRSGSFYYQELRKFDPFFKKNLCYTRESDVSRKPSGRCSGARVFECASRRARLDEGLARARQFRFHESGGSTRFDTGDASEGRGRRVSRGL